MKKNIGIRVDVDFEIGMVKGVPFLLDFFAEYNIKATFYIAMGPDGFGRHKERLKTEGYAKRLAVINPFNMLSKFGMVYIAQQCMGRGGDVGRAHRRILKRILSEGHELGVHGFDHYWWAENIWNCEAYQVKEEIVRGLEAFKQSAGADARVWASPNWRCSARSLELVDAHDFLYGADCRGKTPFFPVMENRQAKTMQLPITMPCLHEIKGYLKKTDDGSICKDFITHLNDSFNIWCIHGYYEGILERRLFLRLVKEIFSKDYTLLPLRKIFLGINRKAVLPCGIIKKILPGGRGEVSCQAA